jgi:hypothetical protein
MQNHLSRVIDDLLDATELAALEEARTASAKNRERIARRFSKKTGHEHE